MAETQPAGSTAGATRVTRTTRPLRGTLAATSTLAVVFVVYTILVIKWGPFIHLDDFMNRNFHVHAWWPLLHVVDRLGQRAVCLPVLISVIAYCTWRQRTWRPILLSASAVFAVNLIVLIAKLAFGRGHPLMHQGFFTDGDDYPSGHTANVIVVYGLCYSMLVRYAMVGVKTKRVLFGVVCALCVVMFSTSLLLRWHWFSDLIGGFMVGGGVLLLLVGIDAWVPFESARLVVAPPEAMAVPPAGGATPSPAPSLAQVPQEQSARARATAQVGAGAGDESVSRKPRGSEPASAGRLSRR